MLVEIVREKTRGAQNEIELTQNILSELAGHVPKDDYCHYVKGSKVFLAIKAPYGFWVWKENGTQKSHCDPGDYIVIEPNEGGLATVHFKKQEAFDAMVLTPLVVPSLLTPCQFYEEKV